MSPSASPLTIAAKEDKASGALAAVEAAAQTLLPPGARVLVACSGGPDSQALLDFLCLLRTTLRLGDLWAVGIDHQLRAGAAQELSFAQRLAERHGVAFFCRKVRVAPQHNVLAAARTARYGALRAVAKRLGATHLALGHTATDQVETLLLNLCRGSSLRGAGAIRAKRGPIVRPLLQLGRVSIVAWLAARGIAFAQDPSNHDKRRARARLRAEVLPALLALNPKFETNIGAFCREAQDDEACLRRQAKQRLRRGLGPLASLDTHVLEHVAPSVRRRVVALWLRRIGAVPTRSALARVAKLLAAAASGRCGPQGTSVGGADIVLERGRLWCGASLPRRAGKPRQNSAGATAERSVAPPPTAARIRIDAPSCTSIFAASQLRVQAHTVHTAFEAPLSPAAAAAAEDVGCGGDYWANPGPQTVAFDADRLHFELILRPWQQGDKLQPFGLKGRIKVGDLFTNHKVPRALRSGWPLLMCGDEVLWVVGLRRSAHAPVTATTRRIVTLKVEDALRDAQNGASPARPRFF